MSDRLEAGIARRPRVSCRKSLISHLEPAGNASKQIITLFTNLLDRVDGKPALSKDHLRQKIRVDSRIVAWDSYGTNRPFVKLNWSGMTDDAIDIAYFPQAMQTRDQQGFSIPRPRARSLTAAGPKKALRVHCRQQSR